MRPLADLTELASHKEQFLSRLGEHIGEEQPQVSEFLPFVARHFADQRTFSVHHLVMAQRQHEILVERIEHAKGQLVVVVLAVDGVLLEIGERVVHPAHVPLQAEPQASQMRGPRNHGVGGGLFGEGLDVWVLPVGFEVEAAQEIDGLQILAPAEFVRNPLARIARVVEV